MKQQIKERIERIKQGLVPSGYKQTPVGVCPNDWKFDTLGNLGEFSKGSGIPGYTLVESGIPCVGYGDLYTKYSIKFEKAKCFTDIETAKQSKEIVKGTLLFTGSGETAEEIGKCVCYNGDENICAGGDIVLFNTKKVNPLYISYQQNLDRFIKEKSKLGQGHSVVHIYANDLSTLSCLYPSEDKEQTKIANVLTTWDNAVELQEKKIEKLQEKKKALMQTLLNNNGYEKMSLQELIDISYFRLVKPKELNKYHGQKIYLSTSSIINDQIVSNEGYYSDDERPSRAQMLPLKNSVWFAKMKNSIKVLLADEELESNYILSTGFYGFMPIQNLVPEFLKQVFLSDYFNEQKNIFAEGSSQNGIKDKNLSDIYVYIPSYQEQKEIAKIFKAFDKNLDLENLLLEKYKEQRKSLMQLLLTGIVRV